VTFTVLCEKVYAEFKSLDEATIVHHGGRPAEQLKGVEVVREVVRSEGDNFDALAADFVSAIREGRPARSTIEDGLRDLQLVLGAQASGRAGGAVQRLDH
jgi:predicted dehydrogenase